MQTPIDKLTRQRALLRARKRQGRWLRRAVWLVLALDLVMALALALSQSEAPWSGS